MTAASIWRAGGKRLRDVPRCFSVRPDLIPCSGDLIPSSVAEGIFSSSHGNPMPYGSGFRAGRVQISAFPLFSRPPGKCPRVFGLEGAAAQLVVGVSVAGHPARQLLVRIGAGGDIDVLAVPVIALAVGLAGALEPAFQLVVGLGLGLEGDVVVAADLRWPLSLRGLVHFRGGE